MARPLRVEVAGGWYHVTARGNERKAIFRDDGDRERFLTGLGNLERRFGVEVHAYVLMDNHYHLLVRLAGDTGLSASMQWLGTSYTTWFNRRHRRVGHLFQGRFKAILVEFEGRGAEVSRYLHCNPVRVKRFGLDKQTVAARRTSMAVVERPEAGHERVRALRRYRWSSYRAYVGRELGAGWLRQEALLEKFGGAGGEGRKGYGEFVEEVVGSGCWDEPWKELRHGLLLGAADWSEQLVARIRGDAKEQPGLREIARRIGWEDVKSAVERVRGESWQNFVDRRADPGRDAALYLARTWTPLTNRALGDLCGGLDDSSVAQAVRRFRDRMSRNPEAATLAARAEAILSHVKI